jgi:hypothetical protein
VVTAALLFVAANTPALVPNRTRLSVATSVRQRKVTPLVVFCWR